MLKKRQWLMLPTTKASHLFKHSNKLGWYSRGDVNYIEQVDTVLPQHVYILSDEQIKEGDYRCNQTAELVCTTSASDAYNLKDQHLKENPIWKKVIASSNKTLKTGQITDGEYDENHRGLSYVPQIRESVVKAFIEDYNKEKKWEWVNVEYEEYCCNIYVGGGKLSPDCCHNVLNSLKLRSDNTVIIHPIQEIFSREEVRKIVEEAYQLGVGDGGDNFSGWSVFEDGYDWFDKNY